MLPGTISPEGTREGDAAEAPLKPAARRLRPIYFGLLTSLFVGLLLQAHRIPESVLYRRCDSQIPWITDGTRLVDRTLPGLGAAEPPVDRLALLARAKEEAGRRNRLILWYCMRGPDSPMYRGTLLDQYMKVSIFTDPAVVDLVQAKFVPLRMACDEKLSAATGLRRLEFVEPGFIILTPEGRILHQLDRIRTFNADWVRSALVAVLKQAGACNAPSGESADELIRGGDDDLAFGRATPDQKALILRRAGRFEEVLRLPCSPLHRGIALLGLQRFDEARPELERDGSAEALYHLAAIDAWTGRDPQARWKELVGRHPETPWAWRAASELVKGRDTLRDGPVAHHFDDFFLVPPKGAPASTRLPGTHPLETARRAVAYLLRAQRENGAWNDSRYSYYPSVKIQPNVFVAVTALAALALREWRELDPGRIDDAVSRAKRYLLDESHLNPGQNEECYAQAYRLLLLAPEKDTARMNEIVPRLLALQDKEGFFSHEYPNPFTTAAVVHCLHLARQAGAKVPDSFFQRARGALLKTRGEGGPQAYTAAGPPSSEKNSAGRIAPCELALYECGAGSLGQVAGGLDAYWRHLAQLETIRLFDFHSDEELAGFFFFHAVFHSCEAARALTDPALRKEHLARFRAQVMSIPEWDGSFLDSHELGKSYGTAMALLVLHRTR